MLKKNNSLIAIFVCLGLFLLFCSVAFKKNIANRREQYENGFNRGYNAFLAQMADDPENEKTIFKYTKIERIPELSKESNVEMTGYVDGYHKAAELYHCPGRND